MWRGDKNLEDKEGVRGELAERQREKPSVSLALLSSWGMLPTRSLSFLLISNPLLSR